MYLDITQLQEKYEKYDRKVNLEGRYHLYIGEETTWVPETGKQ